MIIGFDKVMKLCKMFFLVSLNGGRVSCVSDFSTCRDNSKLCSCGGDRQIFYWDVATGKVIRKFRGHDSEVGTNNRVNSFTFA